MKKVLLSVLFVGLATIANAQKSELEDGKKNWNLYELSSRNPVKDGADYYKRVKLLTEGVAHLDKAVLHDKTKNLVETWAYKSLFNSAIASLDTVNVEKATSLEKVAESDLVKAKEFAKSDNEKELVKFAEDNVLRMYNVKGFKAYEKKDINGAYNYFNILSEKNPADTTMLKNAGFLASELKKYPEAIKSFRKAIELKVGESKALYSNIINIHLSEQKDTTAALGVLDEASLKYPDEIYFITAQADIYIKKGNSVKAEQLIDKLIAKDDNNADYKIAKGDLYFNNAFELQNKANAFNKAKKTKEADAASAKMKDFLNKALPYYEKALQLKPKNEAIMTALKQIYGVKGDEAKYNEMKKLLSELK